ncbi:hypothetical protein B857_01940 [Solibacillus isronensis B3W22]|uniref:Phage-Barnase-EndoU-ColicinE5/D-RelE like nuclease 4 domain-containing protein n=1 Tax=Solibacillus isronensis B3W22 TaxID=1224748 RepID=K1KZT3_9BACL|nr:PBECR4 domain-containing protein [Solibacillus isronensis]AMO87250.1 hypothetical protein SOLI23_17360 [Solibacillus silvestris]EKB45342.1 hypothetical protein B857_01940 [Solibacillus isronensis B3W22]
MINNIQDLFDLENNPRINDISLILLADFYKIYLNPYGYHYNIVDNSQEKPKSYNIELRFDTENFCHLLAIEKIMKRVKNKEEIKSFKSELGWQNVLNGTITLTSLREKATKGIFNSNKDKYIFFYLLPRIIEAPKGVLFDQERVEDGTTRINCEILFYDKYHNAMVHLGIKYDEELGYHIPQTFFVERVTANKNGLKYVGNQQIITVTKINKSNHKEIHS